MSADSVTGSQNAALTAPGPATTSAQPVAPQSSLAQANPTSSDTVSRSMPPGATQAEEPHAGWYQRMKNAFHRKDSQQGQDAQAAAQRTTAQQSQATQDAARQQAQAAQAGAQSQIQNGQAQLAGAQQAQAQASIPPPSAAAAA